MKKLIYILLLFLFAGITLTACTEENVTPTATFDNGGGAGSERGNP